MLVCAGAVRAAAGPLDAPQLTIKPQGALAAFTGESVDVLVGWRPVPDAVRYRVTLGDATTETTDLRFARKALPIGKYQLTVVAVDNAGNASAPSEPLPLNVLEIRALPPGAGESMGPARGAYAVGTRFSVAGMHCEFSDAPIDDLLVGPENETRMPVAGLATLRCAGIPGYLERQVVVAPITVAASGHAIRGGTSTVSVTVASVAFLGPQLQVTGGGDITVGDVVRTPFGFEVPVSASAIAKTATLTVQSGNFALGRVDVELRDAPARPPPVAPEYVRLDWRAFDLGGHAGAFVPPDRSSPVGQPMTDADAITASPLVGLRLGFFPTRRVGLEGELSLIEASRDEDAAALHVFASRASLAVRPLESSRVGLRFLVGGGALIAGAGTETAAHAGAALTVESSPNLWLRFQILDVVTASRDDGYAHCWEMQLGVVTRIGRRDSW